MARPLWYNTPRKNIARQKIKLAGTPKAMPVIWPLQREAEVSPNLGLGCQYTTSRDSTFWISCLASTSRGPRSPTNHEPRWQTVVWTWARTSATHRHIQSGLIQLFVFPPGDNRTHTLNPSSPLSAVLVTRLAVALPVGVFEDQAPLAVIDSGRARRHAVGAVSELGAGHTLVCSLFRKKEN